MDDNEDECRLMVGNIYHQWETMNFLNDILEPATTRAVNNWKKSM
jgi:hypothetical protein